MSGEKEKKKGGFFRKLGGVFIDTGDKPDTDDSSDELSDERLKELAEEEEKRQATSPTPSAGVPPAALAAV